MNSIFLDSQGVVALAFPDEALHARARSAIERLVRDRVSLVTTNFVLAEVVTIIACREHRHDKAVEVGQRIRASSFAQLVRVTPDVEDRAWDIFVRFSDKSFSYTDCTSFAVMQAMGLVSALTYDEHFVQMGYRALLREP